MRCNVRLAAGALAFALGCSSSTATTTGSGTGDGSTGSTSSSDTTGATTTADTTTGASTGPAESDGPSTDDPTDPSGDPSTCEEEPPCAGVVLDNPIEPHSGWAQGADGEPIDIFLARPGTSCGDDNPAACTDCGNYESLSIGLPAAAQAPGSYTEADGVGVLCSSIVTDCAGNGEGDGGGATMYTVEIVSIDASCIVGEITESDGCGTGQFAVIRCP